MAEQYGLTLKKEARYDLVALGALGVRLNCGGKKIEYAGVDTPFTLCATGAEYNVAGNLRRLGFNTAVMTAMADYEIGRLIRNQLRHVGVDILGPTYKHTAFSGNHSIVLSNSPAGVMPNNVGYMRASETAAMIKPGELKYDELLKGGVKVVHSGGLYAALGENTPNVIIEFFQAAKQQGAIVCFDLNYRERLWKEQGGEDKAKQVMLEIVKYVDILFGNETDIQTALGIDIGIKSEGKKDIRPFVEAQKRVRDRFSNLAVLVTSLRDEHDNNGHEWGAVASVQGTIYTIEPREISVEDRIGGGDGLASGFIGGVIRGLPPQIALEMGWANGAAVVCAAEDITQADWKDLEKIAKRLHPEEQNATKVQR